MIGSGDFMAIVLGCLFIGGILGVWVGGCRGRHIGSEETGTALCAKQGARYLDGECQIVTKVGVKP